MVEGELFVHSIDPERPTLADIYVELPVTAVCLAQLTVEVTVAEAPDRRIFCATLPEAMLAVNEGPAGLTLDDFLNLAATKVLTAQATQADLALFLDPTLNKETIDLAARHAASFPELWEKLGGYAKRLNEALTPLPDPYDVLVDRGGILRPVDMQGFLGLDEAVAAFRDNPPSIPQTSLNTAFTGAGLAPPTIITDEITSEMIYRLRSDPTVAMEFDDGTVYAPRAVSDLITDHPDVAPLLMEAAGAKIFHGGQAHDGMLVAYDVSAGATELAAMCQENDRVGVYTDGQVSFTYVAPEQGGGVKPVTPTIQIVDDRPRLQPALVWTTSIDGSRELLMDIPPELAPAVSNRVNDAGQQVIIDPVLGLLVPVICNPEVKANKRLWPEKSPLPADVARVQEGILDRTELRSNWISPAAAALQAARIVPQLNGLSHLEQFEVLARERNI